MRLAVAEEGSRLGGAPDGAAEYNLASPKPVTALDQVLVATAALEATDPRQLSFAKGDTFTAVKMTEGWYVARDSKGGEGLVPSNFVKAQDGALAETSI